MRHWSTNAIIGYILIIFLTNFIVNLTILRTKNIVVKNVKLLKKYLHKLTLAVFYDKKGRKTEFIANFSPEIKPILANFMENYLKKA